MAVWLPSKQTYIEPVLDMWTREHRPNNIVINDPKGELLVKFYVRGAMRGFEIVQLNLINSMKTNICNPLWLAASSAREGDFTKAAMYVENIAEVFFPVDGGDDPVWPNAANNAFKRSAYGLIDFYLEEEAAYRNECDRRIAAGEFIDPQTIETHIDELWGKVTLYNCYQLFVQLTSKKLPNPVVETAKKIKAGEFEKQAKELLSAEYGDGNFNEDMVSEKAEELQNEAAADAEKKGFLWDGAQEADCMSLFFAATERLPRNSMRNLLINAHNALRAIAGAEKMLASCEMPALWPQVCV